MSCGWTSVQGQNQQGMSNSFFPLLSNEVNRQAHSYLDVLAKTWSLQRQAVKKCQNGSGQLVSVPAHVVV